MLPAIYVACGGTSALLCLLVLACFAGTPSLSRYPASMLGWRLVCDAALSLQFVLLNLPLLAGAPAASACSPTLAFLAQFGMFGSLSWFACLSLDLYFSVTRPFTRPSSRLGYYHCWVWAGSALTGLVAAVRHGYRPIYHLCWIAKEEQGDEWLLGSMGGLFFRCVHAHAHATLSLSPGRPIFFPPRLALAPPPASLTRLHARPCFAAPAAAGWQSTPCCPSPP